MRAGLGRSRRPGLEAALLVRLVRRLLRLGPALLGLSNLSEKPLEPRRGRARRRSEVVGVPRFSGRRRPPRRLFEAARARFRANRRAVSRRPAQADLVGFARFLGLGRDALMKSRAVWTRFPAKKSFDFRCDSRLLGVVLLAVADEDRLRTADLLEQPVDLLLLVRRPARGERRRGHRTTRGIRAARSKSKVKGHGPGPNPLSCFGLWTLHFGPLTIVRLPDPGDELAQPLAQPPVLQLVRR